MAYDDNIQALLSAASTVRDETHEGGNTAARVGQLLVDMITSFDSAYKALSDSIPEGVDLSILKRYLSKEEAETLFDTQSVFNRLFVEDTANDAIKALKHLYSVSDITAFGYVESDFPSADVVIKAEDFEDGVLIATINGTPIYAPAGGGTTNFAALTLKINGLNEQYFPTGDSKIFDLDAVYVKKGEGGNVNLDDYYKKTEIETLLTDYAKTSDIPKDYVNETAFGTFKGDYDNLAVAVKDANDYTNTQIAALNISQYAKASALEQVVADVNVAFDAVNNKFADYALLAGNNTLTGTNTFLGYLKLKKGENASGYLFLQDDTTHANYEYQNGVYFALSDGGFAIHAHKDGAWANQIAWIAMDSLETTLQQGISVNKITVRGGGALFNGEALFNYKATFNAKQTWFGDMYIEKYSSYGGFGNGAYFGWHNVANMKLLPTMNSSNILLYTGLITPRVDFSFGSEEVITSSIVESASGVLELLGNSYDPGTLKIGNAYLTYDSDNNALFVKGKDGASVNLVATGDVAAYSGLGSGFDTLTDLTLTNSLTVGGATLTCFTSVRGKPYHALNVANHPLFIGTPTSTIDAYKYQGYGLVSYKSALFNGAVTFEGSTTFKNLTIGTLDINNYLRINPNDTSARLLVGDMSAEITEITADGTNVYITINGKQYKLANA